MTMKRAADADDILLEALRDLGRRSDPKPDDLAASAIAAYRWRMVDAELAALTDHVRLDVSTRAEPTLERRHAAARCRLRAGASPDRQRRG